MILPDWQIREMCEAGMVDAYDMAMVNPASLDLKLAEGWYDFDAGRVLPVGSLEPGRAVLASTVEVVTLPVHVAGQLILKSSMGRRGVSMPAAGWVDPGFSGTLTVQLSACVPVVMEWGQPFLQMVLYRMAANPDDGYYGRYQGQRGVTLERGRE